MGKLILIKFDEKLEARKLQFNKLNALTTMSKEFGIQQILGDNHVPTSVSIELFQMTSDQLLVHRDLLKERLADNLKELQEVLRLMQLMRRACSLEEEEKFIDVQTEVRNLWY